MPPRSTDEKNRNEKSEPVPEKPEAKLDILDDPVRMYLKQMGQAPLLTREQEVEISKRIEDAEITSSNTSTASASSPSATSSSPRS